MPDHDKLDDDLELSAEDAANVKGGDAGIAQTSSVTTADAAMKLLQPVGTDTSGLSASLAANGIDGATAPAPAPKTPTPTIYTTRRPGGGTR